MTLSAFLAFRANSTFLYASVCLRAESGGEFTDWFVCIENAGPGTVRRLRCGLDSGADRKTCAMLSPGSDVVLTVRVPVGDPGIVSFDWDRPRPPFRAHVRHVRLSGIPMLKRSHHRSDFIEDDAAVARIVEWSANEPADANGPVPLDSLRGRKAKRVDRLDASGMILP